MPSMLAKVIATCSILYIAGCAERDPEMGERNNAWDPNSTNWIENALPEVTLHYEPFWRTYNHTTKSGSVRFLIAGSDLNFPYDTLKGWIRINAETIAIPKIVNTDSLFLLVNNLQNDTTYQCSSFVYDVQHDTVLTVFPISTGWGVPPQPPEWSVAIDTNSLIFRWDCVADVDTYTIFVASTLSNSLSAKAKLTQPDSNRIVTRQRASGLVPERYILAITNEYGTALSEDTIKARPYSSRTEPKITQVTKASSTKQVAISLRVQSPSNIGTIVVFRATEKDGSYTLLDSIQVKYSSATARSTNNETIPPQSSVVVYNYLMYDTVRSSAVFYYKAAAFDSIGQCSRFSTPDSGYAAKQPGPYWSGIVSESEQIRLTWTKTTTAAHYNIYRSDTSCSSGRTLLASTSALSYIDTPPTTGTYFYSLTSVDKDSFESAFSDCYTGKVTILPPPKYLTATKGQFIDHIIITWNALPGADGYILYKADSLQQYLPFDTLTDTTVTDSLVLPLKWYYRVAGFNAKGTGELTAFVTGSVIYPEIFSTQLLADTVTLKWGAYTDALLYYIYHGTDGKTFALIDSSTTTTFKQTITTFGDHYYRITMKLPEGVTLPSKASTVYRSVYPPGKVVAQDSVKGVLLAWSGIKGATSYGIYRLNGSQMTKIAETVDTFYFDTAISTARQTYQISTKSKDIESIRSASVSGGIIAIPLTPINVAIQGQLFSIRINWYTISSSSTPSGFKIYRASATDGTYELIDSTSAYSFEDTVKDTLKHFYRVSAFNSLGESVQSSIVSAARVKPSPPQTVTASQATSKAHIQVNWSAVPSIKEYIVYRAVYPAVTHHAVGFVGNITTFFDSTCEVNIRYSYLVSSVAAGNRSGGSVSATGYRLGPPEPTNLSYTSQSFELTWEPLPYSVTIYSIYRSALENGTYIKIGTSTSPGFIDLNPLSGTNSYKISATTTVESDLSTALSGHHLDNSLPAPPKNLTATMGTLSNQVVLTWNRTANVAGYRIYRAPTDTFNRGISVVGETADSTFSDSVSSDSMYYYVVRAFNSWGEGGFSGTPASGYRLPTLKPAATSHIYLSPSQGMMLIGWYRPTTAVGFNGFNVYRSTTKEGTFEFIGSTTGYLYTDIPPGSDLNIYWYYVTTKNQTGESVPSAKASGSELQ